MAIAFDAATLHEATADASSTSFSFSVGAGSDRMLVVAVMWFDNNTGADAAVSSVTYNGVGATQQAASKLTFAATRHVVCEIWTLADPATGSNTLAVSLDADGVGTNDALQVGVLSYNGVDAVGATTGTATGNDTNPTVTFTTSDGASLIVGGFSLQAVASISSITPGTGTTERGEHIGNASSDNGGWIGEEGASGGSDTIDATMDAGTRWAFAAIELTEAAGASPVTVNASPGVVSVSGPAATVVAPIVVAAGAGVVVVSGPSATVGSSTTISAGVGVVSVSGPGATVVAPIVVSASPGVVSVTGNTATITVPQPLTLEETVTGSVDGGTQVLLTSWTPAADELVLLAVAVRDETVGLTVSGNGLTWVEVADVDNVQGQCGIHVFRAMGASPTSGQIQVDSDGSTIMVAIASRFSGADTSGTNGSGAVEASATNSGPATDDDDMTVDVTTSTAGAWAWAAGTHRLSTFTVPGDETAISINQTEGSGGDLTSLSTWYKEISSPTTETMGAAADLSGNTDWATVGISIKPASVEPVTVSASPGVIGVGGQQATVDASTTVTAGPGVVTVSGLQATVTNSTIVSAAVGVVSVSGQQATVLVAPLVAAGVGLISVSGPTATIVNARIVNAGVGVINVVGVRAVVDTVRYVYDLDLVDSAAYEVVIFDQAVGSVELADSVAYSVELSDASRA